MTYTTEADFTDNVELDAHDTSIDSALSAIEAKLDDVKAAQGTQGTCVLNTANGHYYEFVGDSLNWEEARAAANLRFCNGVQGHLATITSTAENTHVGGLSALAMHIGGFQPPGSPEKDGNFQWVTGEASSYDNWATNEPSNSGFAGEEAVMYNAGGVLWNDLNLTTDLSGYVVEYDGLQDQEGQHDTLMQARADTIDTKLDTIDTVVDGIQTDLDNGTDGLGALSSDLGTIDGVVDGIQTDLDNGTDGLGALSSDLATIDGLIGDPDLDATDETLAGDHRHLDDDVAAHVTQSNTIASTFGALVGKRLALKKVDLQVIELQGKGDDEGSSDDDDKGRRFLLVSTKAGGPVDVNVALLVVQVSNAKSKDPIEWMDVSDKVTISYPNPKPGMLEIVVNVPKSVKDAKLYEFRVVHVDGFDAVLDTTIAHIGMIVFDRRHQQNLGIGQ